MYSDVRRLTAGRMIRSINTITSLLRYRRTPMKIALLALAAAFALPLANAEPTSQNPFKDCWMESGPQLRKDALEIPNELLQDNWRKLKDLSNGRATNETYFRLNYDLNTRKLSLSADQSFEDLAQNESEVIVQIGGSAWLGDGNVYGNIETKFGSAYTKLRPQPTGDKQVRTAGIYLQYVNFGEGKYRDLRLHCSYLE